MYVRTIYSSIDGYEWFLCDATGRVLAAGTGYSHEDATRRGVEAMKDFQQS